MADDIKSLAKKNADLEKRLKLAEAKIKALADNMTSSKDIEKYLDVLHKKMKSEQNVSEKTLNREMELSNRAQEAREKERDKAWDKDSKLIQKENDIIHKEMEKMAKDSVRQAEMNMILNRLATVEALVKTALSRK